MQDHGGNFLGGKLGSLAALSYLNHGLVLVGNNVVRDELLVGLDGLVGEVATNQTLDVKDGVVGVDGGLILGGIADETVAILHEGNVRGSDAVTLIVGNDFDAAILEDTDARVRRAEINTNCRVNSFILLSQGRIRKGNGGNCTTKDMAKGCAGQEKMSTILIRRSIVPDQHSIK